jgi:hypothetical protein
MHNGAIMPSKVRHQVDGGRPYPVVRLAGVLDAGTAPTVRSVLLDVLAGQPPGIVVDVRGLAVGAPGAVGAFDEVARRAAEWPGCRLVLCATGDEPAWWDAGLPVRASPAEAAAALGEPCPEHFLSVALEPVVGAARRSRELVTEACARWELPSLAGPACIVVTELVNNVVAHAGTPMTVLLGRRHDMMTVAVRDQSAGRPRFSGEPVPVTSYGGRGLLLIDAVARRWGSLPLAHGKVVWATLDTADEATGDDTARKSAVQA